MFINRLPKPVELVVIAHSMGGLVSRSACHYGQVEGHSWLNHLRKMVFLGTPHHGAPLERAGNWVDILLEISPYSAPFSRLGKIRSAGVTDLRYGNILDEDWKERDRFNCRGDHRSAAPLPEGLQCYTIAAATGKKSSMLGDKVIGDGLVTLDSALGRHKNAELNLSFPKTRQWIARDMNHMDLLSHPRHMRPLGGGWQADDGVWAFSLFLPVALPEISFKNFPLGLLEGLPQIQRTWEPCSRPDAACRISSALPRWPLLPS